MRTSKCLAVVLPLLTLWTTALAQKPTIPATPRRPDATRWGGVRVRDPIVANVLRLALDQVAAQLTQAGCRLIFTDFSDAKGRQLSDKLANVKQDGPGYASLIFFYDPSHPNDCASGALAVTAPESRVVFVCGSALLRAWEVERRYVITALIHEMLHVIIFYYNKNLNKDAGHSHAPAGGVGDTRLRLEGVIDFEETVVRGLIVFVEQHLDDAEAARIQAS